MSFEDFQDGQHGGHLGYQNGMLLAILNLHMAPMPPTKFGLNLTKVQEKNVGSRFSRWPPRQPSWIMEGLKQFWISMSLWHFPSSFGSMQHTVWEMSFEEFQDGWHGGNLGYGKGTILAILNLHVTHQISALPDLWFGRCHLKNFKMAVLATILDIGTERF